MRERDPTLGRRAASPDGSKRPSDEPPDVRHVALAFPVGVAHLQPLVQGIADYARAHSRWSFTLEPEMVELPLRRLHGWQGDGVIAALVSEADRRQAQAMGIPVVSIAGALEDPGVPRVTTDNARVGELAAEHLLACGYTRFAFYGLRKISYARFRRHGFLEVLQRRGRTADSYAAHNAISSRRPLIDELRKLDDWIATLDRPVGIFAANDMRARMVLDSCARLQLAVPGDVGVIGVDDDVVICEFSQPPLSSIRCDWHRVGVEAAGRLDRMMSGESVPPETLAIHPTEVVRRVSTDTLIVENAGVSRVIWHLREHPARQVNIKMLVEMAGISRRALELAFQKEVGCTPFEYVTRFRVERAKVLLLQEPDLKMGAVARRCGFADARRFRIVFQRQEKVTPLKYRQGHAAARGAGSPRGPE